MKVRGLMTPRRRSLAAQRALAAGDIDALLALNRSFFGPATMEKSDDDDDNNDDDTSGDDDDKSKKKKKVKDDDDDDSGAADDDDDDAALEAAKKRMKAADQRATAAEAELQKIRDKDKTDLERAQSESKDLQDKVDTLSGELTTLRLQNAFLTANSHKWHDADSALALAEKKGMLTDVVDDDGVVDKKALGKALDRLAKEHKYLVNSGKDDKDDDEPDGPSGEPAGRRSDNSKDDKAKSAQLRKRFPVLNNR